MLNFRMEYANIVFKRAPARAGGAACGTAGVCVCTCLILND